MSRGIRAGCTSTKLRSSCPPPLRAPTSFIPLPPLTTPALLQSRPLPVHLHPPMSLDPQDVEDSDHDKTPPSSSGLRKRARKAATSSHSASKPALAPQAPAVVPSPVCQTNTVTAAQRLKANWLSLTELVALINFLRNDRTAAEIYSALTEPNVRKEWVCTQLERLGVIVF
ncbi:hypothetical protein B0H34DRAFT_859846 [Crassisporium funariophilum]|nr:hypothetical protein B0H34DRAFT_859846 [Crassisporium funariophilum]